jgi:6-phosphogluconolactonase (cycloisomerase 2 family)
MSRVDVRCMGRICLTLGVSVVCVFMTGCGGSSETSSAVSNPTTSTTQPGSSNGQPSAPTNPPQNPPGPPSGNGASASTRAYIFVAGVEPHGLHAFRIDADAAKITEVDSVVDLPGSGKGNIAVSKNFVYTTAQLPLEDGGWFIITALRVDPATGKLTQLGSTKLVAPQDSCMGGKEVALFIDPAGQNLYAIDGHHCDTFTFAIQSDGSLVSTAPPLHLYNPPQDIAISPDGRLVYVEGLVQCPGQLMTLMVFKRDSRSGTLSLLKSAVAQDYFTHIAFDPSGKYLVAENFEPTVGTRVYEVNYSTGELREVAGSPFVEKDHTFQFQFDNSGKFVYSNTSDSILVYEFSASTGSLMLKQELQSGSLWRSLIADRSLLFVISSNIFGDIMILHRNPQTGELSGGSYAYGGTEAAIIHFD